MRRSPGIFPQSADIMEEGRKSVLKITTVIDRVRERIIIDGTGRLYKKEVIRIVFPSVLTILLFVVTLFAVALPVFKHNLLAQKKALISAEVQTVLSMLGHYEQLVNSGKLSLEAGQKLATDQIREIRYGFEGRGYFWINDMKPVMIMHPHFQRMEGRDLTDLTDSEGRHLFQEFVALAKENNGGYAQYYWKWKKNSERIIPKLSYVKLFQPWGWVVGTGIFFEEINDEIAHLTKGLLCISIVIIAITLLLSFYIVKNSLDEMKKRLAAEKELGQYKDELEELVEQRTEKLQEAMSKVKVLSGFLPICASCKKIRDDKGYWNQIESYIREHSEADFSHGICPDCAKKLYPELYEEK
ncbi:Cache domain-containing protein [Candidatus Electrothrix marina]|uniref:Cache domain-containing protein n=1 Tax=Candidatus Electrothrix marina TaxID=1859130 RepID=A0A444JFA0_9BACT|nr:Cache domain-containing protein [Candidatus Electrothrix marina]